MVEYLDGVLHVHNNTVGVMTNDPDFSWHLRNLNNFVSLSGSWPQQAFSAQTEVGAVPRSVGHGFNLVSSCLLPLSNVTLSLMPLRCACLFTKHTFPLLAPSVCVANLRCCCCIRLTLLLCCCSHRDVLLL